MARVRHGDVHARTGRGDAVQPLEHLPRVDEVLEDVVEQDRVERARQRVELGLDRAGAHLVEHRRRSRRSGLVDLDARDPGRAGLAQPARCAAVAAADVEHASERPRQEPDELGPVLAEVALRLHAARRQTRLT